MSKIHILTFLGDATLCGRGTNMAHDEYDRGFSILGGGIDTSLCGNCVKKFTGRSEQDARMTRRIAVKQVAAEKAAYNNSVQGLHDRCESDRQAAKVAKRAQREAKREAKRNKINAYRDSLGV